jgi:hypothetical protein
VAFTRSRPYHKNDNAHVEQKNWTQVRQRLGWERLEDPQLVALINDLYRVEWSAYQNFFCPSMQLASKVRPSAPKTKAGCKPIMRTSTPSS